MKEKIIATFLVILTVLLHAMPVCADSPEQLVQLLPDGSTVYIFSDGSKLTISAVTEEEPKGTSLSVSAHRYATYTDANDVLQWKYTLTATFTYTYGVSVSCTYANYHQDIYAGNWAFSDGLATGSGNTAHGTGKYEQSFLFIVIRTVYVDLHMTCDVYGVVT